jgi:hypothetical protein
LGELNIRKKELYYKTRKTIEDYGFKSRMLYENVCLWKCSSFLPNSVGPDTKLMLAPNVGSGMILEGEDIGLLFGKEQPPLTSLTR